MALLVAVVGLTLLAGLAMPLGAWVASHEHIQTKWLQQELRHGVIAFGGGTLLSALALVLVPEGIKGFNSLSAVALFCSGGIAFMLLDVALEKFKTPASQLAAMLCDFIPESIILGVALATGSEHAYFLVGIIALQNLPEGFNAYRELGMSSNYSAARIIGLFATMALLGPVAGLSGYWFMQDTPVLVNAIMLLASGGILYSVFQDIAPQAKLENHWGPPLGAVLGFSFGILAASI